MIKRSRDRKRIERRSKMVSQLMDANPHAYNTVLIDLCNTKKWKQFVKSFSKKPKS